MNEAIVLGLGDNIDYEIRWDSSIMENMAKDYAICDSELNTHSPIMSERNLLVSTLGFLKKGSGGERFVADIAIIEGFARHFEKKITLGGTAVRAAIVMRKLGVRSAVHLVTMNDHVTRLLPSDCVRLCSNNEESSYPHLIVQFCAGTEINVNDIHIKTERANRIIYTNDKDNAIMALHPDLPSLLTDAKVFLISGFNCIQDASLLEERLQFLADMLKKASEKRSAGMLTFFEDAGYHKPELSRIVRERLVPYIDIYSLNEDEFEGYVGHPVSWTDASAVADALRELNRIIPVKTLVLHTRFWALAYGQHADKYKKALRGGITMATTRFRFGDDFTKADYEATGTLAAEEAGRKFAAEIEASLDGMLCCVPSFRVTETNVTTIGLGDTFVGGFLPALI
jgi:ADP-dependent phosphofructokinase/glucokinase